MRNKMDCLARTPEFVIGDDYEPDKAEERTNTPGKSGGDTESQAKKVAKELFDTDRKLRGGVATVDIQEAVRIDEDFGNALVYGDFTKAQYWLWDVLRSGPFDYDDVNLVNAPERRHTTIAEIRANEVTSQKLVTIEGEVTSASEKDKADVYVNFKCSCGTKSPDTFQDLLTPKVTKPRDKCRACESYEWSLEERGDKLATQTLLVEDSEVDDSVEMSDILVRIHGSLVGMVESGERVHLTGIVYDKYEDSESIHSTAQFYALGVEHVAGNVDLDVDDEEAETIEETVREPGHYERLQESVAPTLIDLDAEKRGTIAAVFTGGDIPNRDDSIRGDSHVMLLGNPQTGKSALFQWWKRVLPRGDLTTAGNSSGKGLTATAVKDERIPQEYALKAGHVVRCNGGVALIDELDKGEKADISPLHTPLESGYVRRDVGGQKRTMAAKCRVFAAANPVDNVFNDHLPLADQFNFEPSILSRFDLIYAVQSKSMSDVGEDLADNLIDGIKAGQTRADGSGDDDGVADVPYDKEWLTKYIYLAWELDPQFTQDAMTSLKQGWMETVDADSEVAAREHEGLYRLARGFARMRLSETVETIDAERAIEIWKESLNTYAFADGSYDLSIKNDGLPEEETNLKVDLRRAIESRQDDDERGAYIHDVVDALDDDYEQERIWARVERMREAGRIYRSSRDDDYYQVEGGSR